MRSYSLSVALLVVLTELPLLLFAAEESHARSNTIRVSSPAEVRVAPDHCVVTVNVTGTALALNDAIADNDKKTAAVLEVLAQVGIAKADIQTDYYQIDERWNNRGEVPVFKGYWVNKTVIFTLRSIGQFESTLKTVIGAGATEVKQVSFRVTDLRKYRDQARSLALQLCKDKASKMASELGCKIGYPVSITEQKASSYSWYGHGKRLAGSTQYQGLVDVGEGVLSDESTFVPGSVSITAEVEVEYSLSH